MHSRFDYCFCAPPSLSAAVRDPRVMLGDFLMNLVGESVFEAVFYVVGRVAIPLASFGRWRCLPLFSRVSKEETCWGGLMHRTRSRTYFTSGGTAAVGGLACLLGAALPVFLYGICVIIGPGATFAPANHRHPCRFQLWRNLAVSGLGGRHCRRRVVAAVLSRRRATMTIPIARCGPVLPTTDVVPVGSVDQNRAANGNNLPVHSSHTSEGSSLSGSTRLKPAPIL